MTKNTTLHANFSFLIYGAVGESLPLFSIAKITLTAHYKYVYDGQGNIVRSIDIKALKEYNYQYEDGKMIRATECNITLDTNEIVTTKAVVNAIRYKTQGTKTQRTVPCVL